MRGVRVLSIYPVSHEQKAYPVSKKVDPIWVARATAIQAYAELEQKLCQLFSALGDIPQEVASIVFFKIVSSQARRAILEKLFKRKFKDEYSLFRNSLFLGLGPVDTERNEIIHWNIIKKVTMEDDRTITDALVLLPPAVWGLSFAENPPTKTTGEINEFYIKCHFYQELINKFIQIKIYRKPSGPLTEDELRAWKDIFSRPITYPPPEGTPLFQILETLGSQLQSS